MTFRFLLFLADYGNFTYSMDMFKSAQYEEPESYPVIKGVGEIMYLELKVESGDSKLVVFPDWCKATLSSDYSSKPDHLIMKDT